MTDDPEPTETGHWEDYAFITGTRTPGETAGQAGIELNYGGAEDLQLSASIPLDYIDGPGTRIGAGDLALSAKYRFLHQSDETWLPDVAFFPAVNLPTAPAGFGTAGPSWFLPFWAQKDFGKWSIFGGGGYTINPGGANRDFWLFGAAVTRAVTDRLNLGLELYHETPGTTGGRALTNIGFGAFYQLSDHVALLASGGPGLQNATESGQSAFYAALQLTY